MSNRISRLHTSTSGDTARLSDEQVALQAVDASGRLPVESLAEDLFLERLQLFLERLDDREVLIDDEVHERVEHEAGPLASAGAVRPRSARAGRRAT